MTSCHEVANYILWKVGPLTNLNLQKLVYLSHAWYLADYKVPLFHERVIADDQGPVIPDLLTRFADFHQGPITDGAPRPRISLELAEHVNWILHIYLYCDPAYLDAHGCYDPAWHRAMYWVPGKELQREDIIDFYGK